MKKTKFLYFLLALTIASCSDNDELVEAIKITEGAGGAEFLEGDWNLSNIRYTTATGFGKGVNDCNKQNTLTITPETIIFRNFEEDGETDSNGIFIPNGDCKKPVVRIDKSYEVVENRLNTRVFDSVRINKMTYTATKNSLKIVTEINDAVGQTIEEMVFDRDK